MSKVLVWRNISGISGKCNNVIYTRPMLPPSQDILVYFGGDVQDIQESMEKHANSRKYIEWSLQNTAEILSKNFPRKHILIVRPSRMQVTRNAVFSCFDNFVPGNEFGVPVFNPMHNALKHLQMLLESSIKQFQLQDMHCCNIEKIRLTLLGFSKGCVVLNQFLHEFHYYQHEPKMDIEMLNFIKLIHSMWWLDGGHAGSRNTWITDRLILGSFAKLDIHVHVHVTPYQVEDILRPWIRSEEQSFCDTLRNMKVSVEETLHFGDKPRSLKLHFDILKSVKDCAE